jgi:hypothetical protein
MSLRVAAARYLAMCHKRSPRRKANLIPIRVRSLEHPRNHLFTVFTAIKTHQNTSTAETRYGAPGNTTGAAGAEK